MNNAKKWTVLLRYDPTQVLLSTEDPAIVFFTNKLLGNSVEDPSDQLWELPEPTKLIKKQAGDGSWRYKGNRPGDAYGEKYELLETWKNLRILVEKFAFDRRHPVVEKAVEYIFSYQTDEGDIRGILSSQYTPYYMGAMLEIIIKAGFLDDERIHNGFNWLDSMRQVDGGWIIPMNMFKMSEYRLLCQKNPIPPNRALPFSHMTTGMVMRAYAAHPKYRHSDIALHTGVLMKKRLHEKDAFTFRQAISYWYKFQFPFWWTDLVSVLDSLAKIGFKEDDGDIQNSISWFVENQNSNGFWNASYGGKNSHADAWVTLAICRVLKRFLG